MKSINEHRMLLNEMKCIASLETTRQLSHRLLSYLAKRCERLTTTEIEVVGLADDY